MALPEVYTYADALDALDTFSRGRASASQDILRRCIRAGYHEVSTAHDWSFLLANKKLSVYAPQTTGTVTYLHSTGTYPRQLTLVGATWPTWIEDAAVRIDDMVYDVEEYKTPTVVTLDGMNNPGADVAAGTSYSAYPRWYALPNDFGQMLAPQQKSSWGILSPEPFAEVMALDQYRDGAGNPVSYAIAAAPDRYGQLAIFPDRPFDTDEVLSIVYRKKTRELRYSGYNTAEYAGTVTVTAASATVTGVGTTFDSGMIGSIFRISSTTARPTGLEGTNPWAEQRVVASVESGLSLTLDANIATSRAGKGYVISDPIEMAGEVWEAFLQCCEKNYSLHRQSKDFLAIRDEYEKALFRAKGADCRVIQPIQAGVGRSHRGRLADSTDRPILT